jgi:SAM-dependent methyltransferase
MGDAHELSTYFPPSTFDAVYSISVFEHLLMPWKVVLEANRLLKQGGLMFTATHPAWPAHELPADFWRFQKASFHALFNPKTGFEILELSEGLPARMISLVDDKPTRRIYRTGCSMGVSAIARKIADYDPSLAWPVRMDDFSHLLYPQLREDQLART